MLRPRQEAVLQVPEGLRPPVAVTEVYAKALSSQTWQCCPTAATAARAMCWFLTDDAVSVSVCELLRHRGAHQTVSSVEWLEGYPWGVGLEGMG